MQVKVDIPNLPKFRNALRRWPSIAAPEIDRAIKTSIIDIRAQTVVRTPIRTGRLRNSFELTFGPLRAELTPSAEYAIFVHEGTRPHTILPINKQALWWPGAEHPVKSVNHPGTKANPFMVRGVEAAKAKVIENFRQALERITQKIADQSNG